MEVYRIDIEPEFVRAWFKDTSGILSALMYTIQDGKISVLHSTYKDFQDSMIEKQVECIENYDFKGIFPVNCP